MSLGRRLISTGEVSDCFADNVNPFTGTSADGGVALYTLDSDASDESGNYSGSHTDVTFGVSGQINNGASFNGSTSRVLTGLTNTVFNGFTDYSISMWINPSSLSGNEFFAGTINTTGGNGIYLSVQSTGEIRFFERDPSVTATSLTSTDTISASAWSHIVAVRDGSTNYLYVNNGTPVSVTNSTITHDATFQIGRAGSYNVNLFSGVIDQVRVFDEALTSSEVSELNAETYCY